MKSLVIVFLLVAACGKTECQEYAAVYCTKASSCGYSANGVTTYPARASCEKALMDNVNALHTKEKVCAEAKPMVAAMNCAQFQTFAAGGR